MDIDTAPRVLDHQDLERLNSELRNAHLLLNHRLGRLTALFAQSQPTDQAKLNKLQELFEDITTSGRHGVQVAEQLADHQRAVDSERQEAA